MASPTHASVLLWIQAEAPGPVDVVWRIEGESRERRITLDARAADDDVVIARLTGLTPSRTADLSRSAATRDSARGRRPGAAALVTAERDAQDIAIAIGSCFYLPDANPHLGIAELRLAATKSSTRSPRRSPTSWCGWATTCIQPQDDARSRVDGVSLPPPARRFVPLSTLLTATSHLAIWDDHDYGPNDADLSYVMKGEALTLFRRYWANPSYGLPGSPGIFGQRALSGDVDIFLPRRPLLPVGEQFDRRPRQDDVRGEAARIGLRARCVYSSAPINDSSSTGRNSWNRVNRFEGWNHFSPSRPRFAD